jgi:6-phosphogluconolactonase/glucosamine-6-phosphate isomerase/deaminase
MKQTIVSSLGEAVGKIWLDLQNKYTQQNNFHIASPLSSTPIPIYDWIIKRAEIFNNWEKVKFVLMDEMLQGTKLPFEYVPVTDAASYEGFAKEHLLRPLHAKVPVKEEVIKPQIESIDQFDTPIDLLILALGVKGNYANVMPGTHESTGWHIAHLIPEFRQAHTQHGSKSYEGAHFSEYGMSLGPQQVLKAKNIVVIISGGEKQTLAKQLLSYSSFDSEFPLSIIYHPKVIDRVEIVFTEDVLG